MAGSSMVEPRAVNSVVAGSTPALPASVVGLNLRLSIANVLEAYAQFLTMDQAVEAMMRLIKQHEAARLTGGLKS